MPLQGVGTGGALPKTGLWLQPGRSNFRGLGGDSENGRAAFFSVGVEYGIQELDSDPSDRTHLNFS